MEKQNDDKKIINFNRGVEQTTIKKENGSIEIVKGSYTVYLASGGIAALFGVNLATATEYKRICDDGFTDTEISRIRNKGPFSVNPDVNCKRIIQQISTEDEMMLQDILIYLQRLLKIITSRKDAIPEDDLKYRDNLLRLIRNTAEYIRLPKSLELAEELKQLHLCGEKGKDKKYISAIIDKMKGRNIKKFPS